MITRCMSILGWRTEICKPVMIKCIVSMGYPCHSYIWSARAPSDITGFINDNALKLDTGIFASAAAGVIISAIVIIVVVVMIVVLVLVRIYIKR